ncbi:MAG: cellulase family glycosylhydrolase [Proteobacteria bacterium]|nr:cellulase family glycosylhydrolase [Pseudomonadota bacterium]
MRLSSFIAPLSSLILALACKTISSPSSSSTKNISSSDFVQVSDGKFTLSGQPFYFMGSNFYRLALSDAFGGSIEKNVVGGLNQYPQIDKVMENYAKENIRVVRMWGFSCEKSRGTNLIPPIIYRDMKYSSQALEQLDFTIAAAAKHHVKVILTMVNFEPEYCGMEWWVENSFTHASAEEKKRMLYSCTTKDHKDHTVFRIVKDPHECENLGLGYLPTRELFYTDPLVIDNYKKHLTSMLTRVNPYTGKAYRDEPAIMAVEVSNEPHTSDYYECLISDLGKKTNSDCNKENMANYGAGEIVYKWLGEITAFVKTIDTNHLVSSGEEGYRLGHQASDCIHPHEWIHNGSKGVNFSKDVTIPSIDFMTTHLYPDNWAVPPENLPWFDRCIIQDRAALARQNNKPIIMEETGFDENLNPSKPQDYAKSRGLYLSKMFSYASSAGFQGMLVWQAAPLTSNERVAEDDSFTFPIKTRDASGQYNYTSEGMVVRSQSDCMVNYSKNNQLRGDCFADKIIPDQGPSATAQFPNCPAGTVLEGDFGWIKDATTCQLYENTKSQFAEKSGCSCKKADGGTAEGFPKCPQNTSISNGWGWVSTESICNQFKNTKEQFHSKGGCSCQL